MIDNNALLIALNLELDKVRRLTLVQKAYVTLNSEIIVVKLRVDPIVGLYDENFLFYPVEAFSTARVLASINKIIGENM